MSIKVKLSKPVGFIQKFADSIGAKVEGGYVAIPPEKGKGYIRGLLLGNSIGVMIRDYELYEDLYAIRNLNTNSPERILMNFTNVFPSKVLNTKSSNVIQNLPFVQIGRGKFKYENYYPSHTLNHSILMAIETENLKALIGPQIENTILSSIVKSEQPLLFEELISPQIQRVALELIENEIPEELSQFYYRLKAEEMICLLFTELLKRKNTGVSALNELDVQKIYEIRDNILSSLESPPNLKLLAQSVGFSESKLKRLFKQIFGNSVYDYYQVFRMKEAGRLLKEKRLTVSEVGYEMGFSNLSHFSRVFEKHMGLKPKKYSMT